MSVEKKALTDEAMAKEIVQLEGFMPLNDSEWEKGLQALAELDLQGETLQNGTKELGISKRTP
ncbi:MAG: hypothetical protein AAB546_00335 [Patescibacteria group bacterium]